MITLDKFKKLLGEVGKTVSGVDEIFSGKQRRRGDRFTMGADELAGAVRPSLGGEYPPDQSGLHLGPRFGEQRLEGHGDGERWPSQRVGRRPGRGTGASHGWSRDLSR